MQDAVGCKAFYRVPLAGRPPLCPALSSLETKPTKRHDPLAAATSTDSGLRDACLGGSPPQPMMGDQQRPVGEK